MMIVKLELLYLVIIKYYMENNHAKSTRHLSICLSIYPSIDSFFKNKQRREAPPTPTPTPTCTSPLPSTILQSTFSI